MPSACEEVSASFTSYKTKSSDLVLPAKLWVSCVLLCWEGLPWKAVFHLALHICYPFLYEVFNCPAMPSPGGGQQLLVTEALRVSAFHYTNHIFSTEKEYSVLMTPGWLYSFYETSPILSTKWRSWSVLEVLS